MARLATLLVLFTAIGCSAEVGLFHDSLVDEHGRCGFTGSHFETTWERLGYSQCARFDASELHCRNTVPEASSTCDIFIILVCDQRVATDTHAVAFTRLTPSATGFVGYASVELRYSETLAVFCRDSYATSWERTDE